MIDSTAIVTQYLLQNSGVQAQVADRVFGVLIPGNEVNENLPGTELPKFVLLSGMGGFAQLNLPFVEPTYQVRCYGPSPRAAREVYRAVFDALHAVDNFYFAGNYIVWSREEVQGQDLIDPQTGWSFVLAFFNFRFRRS
jgi:hypothetical protein